MTALLPASGSIESVFDASPPHPGYEVTKRTIDAVVALLALALLSPLWLVIAVAIKLTSPGPVLFRADAVGRYGRPYWCLKFRTMRADGDDTHHRTWVRDYVRENRPYAVVRDATGREERLFKVVKDPRVTSVGRLLRRTGLDEAPQFVNVLRGEMSIVGPRPPRVFEYEHYSDRQRHRLDVRPGITGLYQVTARARASFDEVVALDFEYMRRRSVWLDFQIMARTIPVMVLGRGGF